MYKPVMYEPISCEWCLKSFIPNRCDKRFCSKSCYKQYGKKSLGHSKGNVESNKIKLRHKNREYLKYRKTSCELCGFVPKHICQLDVDHIDGDHTNNSVDNLQTLCANCHRLKTAIQLGWYI